MRDILTNHLLSVVIFVPLIGAIIIALLPLRNKDNGELDSSGATVVKAVAMIFAVLDFLLSLMLIPAFQSGKAGFQLQEGPYLWISRFNVHYHLGIDGISLLLILLTTFLCLLSVIYSFNIKTRLKEYMVFIMILETAMLGVFCALDLVLFYVFWESVLIPMYFLIGIWGHERRIYAAIKFFLYTFAGSVLMLLGIVFLYVHTHTFSLIELTDPRFMPYHLLMGLPARTLLYLYSAFALAFMIKVPMFPFHTWLPDAHVEAPTAGSVILAGVMLKMGVYGFLRFCIPLFPEQARNSAPLFITLAIIGIIYGAIVAAVQPDMKKLVAYSSVSHLGFVMLGIFSFTTIGMTGAVLQSVNHGVSTGMLFFMVGMMYDRKHTREIKAYGGLKRSVPILAAFFMIALFSSIGLPLTNGFIGEFTIMLGSYLSPFAGINVTALACIGIILSAVYMLWLFQRVFTGPLDKEENKKLFDLNWREKWVLAPLVVMIFWFGCYVTTWTNFLHTPVNTIMRSSGMSEASREISQRVAKLP